jgi:hypothetical protein
MLNMLCDDRTMFIPLFKEGADAAQHSYMQKKVQVVSQPYSVKKIPHLWHNVSLLEICLCNVSLHNKKWLNDFTVTAGFSYPVDGCEKLILINIYKYCFFLFLVSFVLVCLQSFEKSADISKQIFSENIF